MKVINPYSRETVCVIDPATREQVQSTLDDARAAFDGWRRTSIADRVAQVRAGLDHFGTNRETIAREITLQMGKPIAQARSEVDAMCERGEHMAAIAPDCLTPEVLPEQPGFHRRIEHAPLGVVLNLAAWNYPLLIAVNVIVPALLAGNVVVLKHSSRTPLCGRHFTMAFPNVADLVLDHDQTAELIRSGQIDHVAFTGSVDGGRDVLGHAAASLGFIDTGLELGGADPAYVAADADLQTAVVGIVDGACYNAGQSCCAIERAYVHRDRYEEFLDRAGAELRNYELGDPLDERTTMGPMASSAAIGLLRDHIADAVDRGARLLLGGDTHGDAGQFFTPTLLADCGNDCRIMQEESFGPLLPVASVADDDEAIARMNDSRFGLSASVWTADRPRAERFAGELQAGTVFQNRCDYLDPALPWTGWRDSGKGSTLSSYGFTHLTRRKAIHFRA